MKEPNALVHEANISYMKALVAYRKYINESISSADSLVYLADALKIQPRRLQMSVEGNNIKTMRTIANLIHEKLGEIQ